MCSHLELLCSLRGSEIPGWQRDPALLRIFFFFCHSGLRGKPEPGFSASAGMGQTQKVLEGKSQAFQDKRRQLCKQAGKSKGEHRLDQCHQEGNGRQCYEARKLKMIREDAKEPLAVGRHSLEQTQLLSLLSHSCNPQLSCSAERP